jgi:hypothetical protein
VREVELLEGDDAAGFQVREQRAERGGRISGIHEHRATDHRVEGRLVGKFPVVRFHERHSWRTELLQTLPGARDDRRIPIDANDVPCRTHEGAAQERHITDATTHVENAHTGGETSVAEETLAQRTKEPGLLDEALSLVRGEAHDVGGVVGRVGSHVSPLR